MKVAIEKEILDAMYQEYLKLKIRFSNYQLMILIFVFHTLYANNALRRVFLLYFGKQVSSTKI